MTNPVLNAAPPRWPTLMAADARGRPVELDPSSRFADPLMSPAWPGTAAPHDFLADPPAPFHPALEDKLSGAGFHASAARLREAQVDLSLAVRALADERQQALRLLERAGGAEQVGLGQSYITKFERGVQAFNHALWNLQVRERRLIESPQPSAGQVDALEREHRAVLWQVGELRPMLETMRNFALIPGFKNVPEGFGGSGLVPTPKASKSGSAVVPMVTVTCREGEVTVPVGTSNPCQDHGGSAVNPNDN